MGTTSLDYRVGGRGVGLEVKTKDRTVIPQPHYEATIPAYNSDHQQPDWYVFISLLRTGPASDGINRFTSAFLVGSYPGQRFHAEAKLWRAGETDPRNGTTFWTDCFNMPISSLMDIEMAARQWDTPHPDAT